MIAGIFHKGSGLGDQLFRYITTRTLAEDKGYEWGMVTPENFKGASFMSIDMGREVDWMYAPWDEREIRENGIDVRSYDPEINFVPDNTIIDGCFEDDKYWRHKLPHIGEWLRVEPLDMADNVCVIGFRGGEFATVPDLFLSAEYWHEAIERMESKWADEGSGQLLQYEVHTDDVEKAKEMFEPMRFGHSKSKFKFTYTHNIGLNWRSIRYARYAIIANSAFYILPRLLRHCNPNAFTIAPRYWARRNIKVWARPATYYKEFTYI